MTKNEFISALSEKLSTLPQAEIEKSISYYSEIIDDRIEDGMSEHEAVFTLEEVGTIAEKIMYETPLPVLMKARMQKKDADGKKVFNILFLILGFPLWFPLLLAFVIVLLSIYIVIWSLIISLYAIVLSFAVGGVMCLFASPFLIASGSSQTLMTIGGGLVLLALTAFTFFPAIAASKGLIKLTKVVAKKTKSLFIKKESITTEKEPTL